MKSRIAQAIEHLKRCVSNRHFKTADAEYLLSVLEPALEFFKKTFIITTIVMLLAWLLAGVNIGFFISYSLEFGFSILLFTVTVASVVLSMAITCIYLKIVRE